MKYCGTEKNAGVKFKSSKLCLSSQKIKNIELIFLNLISQEKHAKSDIAQWTSWLLLPLITTSALKLILGVSKYYCALLYILSLLFFIPSARIPIMGLGGWILELWAEYLGSCCLWLPAECRNRFGMFKVLFCTLGHLLTPFFYSITKNSNPGAGWTDFVVVGRIS